MLLCIYSTITFVYIHKKEVESLAKTRVNMYIYHMIICVTGTDVHVT